MLTCFEIGVVCEIVGEHDQNLILWASFGTAITKLARNQILGQGSINLILALWLGKQRDHQVRLNDHSEFSKVPHSHPKTPFSENSSRVYLIE